MRCPGTSSVVSASHSTDWPNGALAYQWLRAGTPIALASSAIGARWPPTMSHRAAETRSAS